VKAIQLRLIQKGGSLFVCFGRTLNEPVAWGGPIVMNTQEELDRAFEELDEGTFIKLRKQQKRIEEAKIKKIS